MEDGFQSILKRPGTVIRSNFRKHNKTETSAVKAVFVSVFFRLSGQSWYSVCTEPAGSYRHHVQEERLLKYTFAFLMYTESILSSGCRSG